MAHPTQDPQRLRRRRIEAGLNQGELAEKAGISESYMSCLALGTRNASPRVLQRLAKALNCDVSDLMPPEPDTTADAQAGAA
ncbi:helix-turn-helix transcriptional regulator [Streptomyces sp. NPDC051133]|uniref:helix-turn-helix domain-containing protein n=1 Tax=Streptomyces sp. NPDC051133 TaxID=3155521 RepID=UPI00342F4687